MVWTRMLQIRKEQSAWIQDPSGRLNRWGNEDWRARKRLESLQAQWCHHWDGEAWKVNRWRSILGVFLFCFGRTWGMQKFQGQGSNPRHPLPNHCNDNATSLTCCATWEFRHFFVPFYFPFMVWCFSLYYGWVLSFLFLWLLYVFDLRLPWISIMLIHYSIYLL